MGGLTPRSVASRTGVTDPRSRHGAFPAGFGAHGATPAGKAFPYRRHGEYPTYPLTICSTIATCSPGCNTSSGAGELSAGFVLRMVGGGAAGFDAAMRCRSTGPGAGVVVLLAFDPLV